MKRKVLSVLLVAAICTVMAGCEGKSSAVAETAPAVEDDIATEEPATSEYMDDAAIADSYTEQQDESATEAAEDDFGRPPEEDITDWNKSEEASENIEGIIVLMADWHTDMYILNYDIVSLNPITGSQQKISSFCFDRTTPIASGINDYLIDPAYEMSRFSNYSDQFSSDYTQAAATKTFLNNKETHAGWIDQQGNFFDVTEALDEQSHSDFEDPIHYKAVGFTDDGCFAYADAADQNSLKYYFVSLNNITPGASWEVSGADRYIHDDRGTWRWMRDCQPSDWIDDNSFLGTIGAYNVAYSRIANVTSQTIEEYIPGSSRHHWGAVLSPDGDTIAFLSATESGNEGIGLYTISITGDDPVAIKTSPELMYLRRSPTGSIENQLMIGIKCSTLLDWR